MLHVILLILKIIGIILAVLLGILLVVLLTVLLAPIRYQAFVSRREDFRARAKLTWLLHLISVPVVFQDGELSVKLKLFGITVKDFLESGEKLSEDAEQFFEETDPKPSPDLREREPVPEREAEEAPVQYDPVRTELEQRPKPSPILEPERKQGVFEKLRMKWRRFKTRILRILKKIRNLKYTFRRFCVKIKRMAKKLRDTKDFLTDERTKKAFGLCLSQLKVLLGRLLPKRVRGEVHFGTDDPALTGQILGGISIFYPVFMDNVKVMPDFGQKCLDGELFVKGRLRLATVVLIAIRLLKDKNVRYVYRKLNQS